MKKHKKPSEPEVTPDAAGQDGEGTQRRSEKEERREFLKQAGKAGLGMGLAHFLLVGGAARDAAASDACQAPYTASVDTCNSTDADVCDPTNKSGGDICSTTQTDECGVAGAPDSGDECTLSGDDQCTVIRETFTTPARVVGDLCQSNVQLADVCYVTTWLGVEQSYGDDCVIDYDTCSFVAGPDNP